MPDFSVSLGMFFTELPVTERFAAAADAGFSAVEMFWPDAESVAELERSRAEAGVEIVLINMDEGDYAAGERGFAADPARTAWWRERCDAGLNLAAHVGCRQINVLTGNIGERHTRSEHVACLIENLRWAAPRAAEREISLLIEPLNAATHPRYLCQRTAEALAVIDSVGGANVRVQYDVYQAQRGEGDIVATLRRHHDQIGHVQIADVPGRGAPGTGELNIPYILDELDALGYSAYVGLEYAPDRDARDPFAWLPRGERAGRTGLYNEHSVH